ncbi:hypothetical protein MKY25_10370 [Geobacillus sp. FSL W8-0032]|uniref:hypothetical protein n=1 Tax=Geobacillus TaxID=129337 RepID=UPI000ADE2297|nr:hypothetical protein [Geobacillus icigianus]
MAPPDNDSARFSSFEALLLYLNGWRELSEKIPPSLYNERLVEDMVRLFFYGVKGETR